MILISGGNGQLGFELKRILEKGTQKWIACGHEEWDLADAKATEKFLSLHRPKVVINCAAYTNVDGAESEESAAKSLNGDAVKTLASLCREYDSHVIHISTDFVFGDTKPFRDGTVRPYLPGDPTAPRSVYAKTKEEGERALIEIGGGMDSMRGIHLIRTSWVYSMHGKNFPKTILRLASDPNRSELTVIEDQIGRPTWAARLADFIIHLIDARHLIEAKEPSEIGGELLHFSNSGVASWYDFARAVIELGFETGLLSRKVAVRPISASQYPLPAVRPNFSVMDLKRTRELYPDIPHWYDDLKQMMLELNEHGVAP